MLMRNGGIDIQDGDCGNLDIVFCGGKNYCSHSVSWAEAEALAKLLTFMAGKVKSKALGNVEFEVLNELGDKARAVVLEQDSGKTAKTDA